MKKLEAIFNNIANVIVGTISITAVTLGGLILNAALLRVLIKVLSTFSSVVIGG